MTMAPAPSMLPYPTSFHFGRWVGEGRMMMDTTPINVRQASRIRECRGRAEVLCAAAIQFSQFRVSKRPCRFMLRPKPEHAKSDGGIFFGFGFFFFREATALLLPKVSRRQTADRRAVSVGEPLLHLCTNHPLISISRPTQSRLRRRGQRAKQQARQPAGGSASRLAILQLHWQCLCTALASRNCALQLLSTFSNPHFILHSRAISLSLSHTHTQTHTRRPPAQTHPPACLPTCPHLPALSCPDPKQHFNVPGLSSASASVAASAAHPLLLLSLAAAPSCIAIAENILITSTRRRLKSSPSQAPSSPSTAAHCLHSFASFLLVVGHSLLLPLGLFLPSLYLSLCLSPCLSLSLASCTSEPHIVGTTLVVRLIACTATTQTTTTFRALHPFLATFGESHRNNTCTYTSSSTVLLPSS